MNKGRPGTTGSVPLGSRLTSSPLMLCVKNVNKVKQGQKGLESFNSSKTFKQLASQPPSQPATQSVSQSASQLAAAGPPLGRGGRVVFLFVVENWLHLLHFLTSVNLFSCFNYQPAKNGLFWGNARQFPCIFN